MVLEFSIQFTTHCLISLSDQPRLIISNTIVGPRSLIGGLFNRFVKRTEKFLDYSLNHIQSSNNLSLSSKTTKTLHGTWKLKSTEEGETAVAEQQDFVSVPISPFDTLRMYFQADGMLNEAEIPKVSKALEGAEGVSNLKVQVLEGIDTVELTKQTTVQATGVASNLVQLIHGAVFKLQTLNLSFNDEEGILA
ncbi:Detected protein of confused Function [Hibiscus syriacus]|uniref:Detected protein of confused Function n=1 Tax=Hibiscus syriacus TaxID=106335 RepID=A0A6A2X418_HIBSY|nr:uncharacterized protein LOC120176166 [Hibiscus syriacus]KAE8669581.1 Detected protein of confused Function [Hibiscus syriacus]